MAKTQAQIGMKVKKMKISPSKPITVFRTGFHRSHTQDRKRELEDVKGEANIRWSECENYHWVWENAVKYSVNFHSHFDLTTLEYRVIVTAIFKPEDLTHYIMRFGSD